MRRTSKEKQEVDLLSCSYLKVQRKSSQLLPNILSNQLENPVLQSCTSTEDQQSQKLKMKEDEAVANNDNFNQELQKQKNVILSSNSDIQGDLNQDFFVETPTNLEKPVDEIEKQFKMESKKYYTMSCIKKKNQFQKKISKHKECNTDGQIQNKILTDQLQNRDSYLENYNIKSLQLSFDQNKQQVNKSSFEEEEEEEDQHEFSSSYCSSNCSQDAPYVTAFDIQSSPQKKRFLNLQNSGDKYINQFQNEQTDSYLEDIEKQKQENYEILKEVYHQLEKEIEMEEQSQFNQKLEMNDFVQQMRNYFSLERKKQNGNHTSSRSSCASNYSQASSVHQIWDNSPLRQRGIDTDSWVDLKSLDDGQFKKFTLFHLYKARCAQFDGKAITNSAVVDIMRRFIRNKRVQDISGYPWFSFDDKFDYVNIEEDLKKDPLCKVFLEYSKHYKDQREKKDNLLTSSPQYQQAPQDQTQEQNLTRNQFQENYLKAFQHNQPREKQRFQQEQQEQQQQRKQLKTELRESLLNSSTNKKLKQIFITEMIQPNAPRNQYKALKEKEKNYEACEILQTEYSQNTYLKDTFDKVDLENIQAITQTSEENINDKNNIIVNGFSEKHVQQTLSENKSPQFAQNFYPNFTMDGTLISNVVLNTLQNNQNCSSFIGAIYNNLNKCETTNSYMAENYHQQQLNQSLLEQSPEQNELDYIQKRQKQILEKITSTPLRINQHLKQNNMSNNQNNQTSKTIKKYNNSLNQNGVDCFYNFNKKQSLSNKKERNLSSSSSAINNKNKQHIKKEEARTQSQMTPIKKNKNKEKNNQYDQNSTKSQKKKQTVSSSLNGHLTRNENISKSKIYTQENYYDHKSIINKKQKSNSSMANDLSFSKNDYFIRNSADSISISKQRSVSQQQSNAKNKNYLYGNKLSDNARYSKTPNKKDMENSYTLAKKDFTNYFKKDYAKYYSRRRFVSSSCEKMLRLNTHQAQNCSTVKKKQQIQQSPQIKMQKQQSCSTQKISKQYNILNSILQNQKINENERSKLLSNYFSNHLRVSGDDSRYKYENFAKNITTSEFNIDGYLNQNLEQEIIDSKFVQQKPNNNNIQVFGQQTNSRIPQNYSQINQNIQTEKSFDIKENILTENNKSQNFQDNRKSQHQLSFIIQQLNRNSQLKQQDQNLIIRQNETKSNSMKKKDEIESILQKNNINNTCNNNHLQLNNNNNQKNKLLVYKALKNKQILKPYQQNLQYI
ncbi:hypothetical protein ABPG74_000034 [Tetrahymena malaccensis]